ncbi:TIGR02270 family protein, partial [Pyxidicoccus fallax]|nr:TIGR02270 family protein [Pyxidicoccus fallax]
MSVGLRVMRMVSILVDVFEEHLSEAAFHWFQWEQALLAPDANLQETAGAEERLRAHLDGLSVGGELIAEALLSPCLESEEPAELFVAAFALMTGDLDGAVEPILASLSSRPPGQRSSIQRALELVEWPDVAGFLRPLLGEAGPGLQALALEVLAFHHVVPDADAVASFLEADDERTCAAALRCLTPLPPHLARVHLPRLLVDSRSAVRDAALEAGLLSGTSLAWEQCLNGVGRGAIPTQPQMLLLGLRGGRVGVERLIRLLDQAELRAGALWALGFSGQVVAAEACLKWMEQEATARLAGEAFSAITGLRLEGVHAMDGREDSSGE